MNRKGPLLLLFILIIAALLFSLSCTPPKTEPVRPVKIADGDIDPANWGKAFPIHYDLWVLAVVGGYGASTVDRILHERRQRLLIKSMFSTYVSPSMVDELVANPEKLLLGGRRDELTVLFSDIEGFMTISQNMPPDELVGILNEYLSDMAAVVFKYSGTLDKYEGDAVMAFWGAPVPQQDHALRACLTALEMQEAVDAINVRWQAQGKPRIRVRIGINTGDMVVGNLGSEGEFDYTVIGGP